jgi:alanine dehydrogenase
LANLGYAEAVKRDLGLARGVNVIHGKLTYKAVAEALNLEYTPLSEVLETPQGM